MSSNQHGVEDGRLGVGVSNRKRGSAAIIGAAKSRLHEWFTPRISDLESDIDFVGKRISKVEGLIARCGEPMYSLIATAMRGGLGVGFILAETVAVSGGMAVFGLSGTWCLILAFAFMAAASAYLELAVDHWHRHQRMLAAALVPVALIGTAALIKFRLVYLEVVEVGRYPGLRGALLQDGGVYLAVTLGAMAIMFAVFSSASWAGVGQSLTHYGLCFRLHRLEAKLALFEKKLRRLQAIHAARLEQLKKIEEAADAEHSRGVEVGQLQPAKWESFEPIPAVLTVGSVGAGALLAALGLGLVLWPRLGFAGVAVALLVGIIAFGVTTLRVLPTIKKERQPVQLKLAFPLAGLLVLGLALLTTGCGVVPKIQEAPPAYTFSRHGVALVDVSRSVPVSDAELLMAVETIIKHLPLCSKLTVAPIGGSRGQAISLDLPCEVEGFGDNVHQQYSEFRKKLHAALPEWRKHGDRSDYVSAMTLAAELLDGTPHGALVVLGDLVQDVGDKPKIPVVPDLGGLRLNRTNVYLGLLESIELAKLSPQKQKQLLDGWRARIKEAGAAELLPREFGLLGLEDWCKNVLGPPTETYVTFAISSTGGGK